jgi:hypothetical protein
MHRTTSGHAAPHELHVCFRFLLLLLLLMLLLLLLAGGVAVHHAASWHAAPHGLHVLQPARCERAWLRTQSQSGSRSTAQGMFYVARFCA